MKVTTFEEISAAITSYSGAPIEIEIEDFAKTAKNFYELSRLLEHATAPVQLSFAPSCAFGAVEIRQLQLLPNEKITHLTIQTHHSDDLTSREAGGFLFKDAFAKAVTIILQNAAGVVSQSWLVKSQLADPAETILSPATPSENAGKPLLRTDAHVLKTFGGPAAPVVTLPSTLRNYDATQ